MPYKSMKDVNPSIKGIKPPVTLSQANKIAAMADAIDEDAVDSPWAVAIANFKKTHKAENGRWVKKAKTKEQAVLVTVDGKTVPLLKEVAYDPYDAVPGAESPAYIPINATSFEEVHDAEVADRIAKNVEDRVRQFRILTDNIMFNKEIDDRATAMRNLVEELIEVLALEPEPLPDLSEGAYAEGAEPLDSELGAVQLLESVASDLVLSEPLEESAITDPADGKNGGTRSPVKMDIELIQPGWGNSRDNNFYPAETLHRDAKVFEGAKMYSTGHDKEKRDVRSEVGLVEEIVSFTPAGAPVATVTVFDPGFAESIRNRHASGHLDTLEVSILANGLAEPKFEHGGRKGKRIKQITEAISVDFVPRAGAGGRAIALAEDGTEVPGVAQVGPSPTTLGPGSTEEVGDVQPVGLRPTTQESARTDDGQQDKKGGAMSGVTHDQPLDPLDGVKEGAEQTEPVEPKTEESVSEEQPVDESVTLSEGEDEDTPETTSPTAEDSDIVGEGDEESEKIVFLDKARVGEVLQASKMPKAAQAKLAEEDYLDEQALLAAIQAERAYLQEVVGAGKPVAMGESSTPSQEQAQPLSEEEDQAAYDKIMLKYNLQPIYGMSSAGD